MKTVDTPMFFRIILAKRHCQFVEILYLYGVYRYFLYFGSAEQVIFYLPAVTSAGVETRIAVFPR